MNLAVFVKHVPDTAEAELVIAADGQSLKTAGLPYQMNEWDRFALEEAVRLKEAGGGSLTAYLLGPEESEDSLRRCLAVGADRAVRVWDPALANGGPWAAATTLAAALGETRYDLLLCGAQADDDGYAAMGGLLAERLGLPSAALVSHLEVADGKALCHRELEAGWTERVELTLPALVTIQTGINQPRYVSILGIRKARSKLIDLLDRAALGLPQEALDRARGMLDLTALELPPPGRAAEILLGTPEETARQLFGVLKEKGGVL